MSAYPTAAPSAPPDAGAGIGRHIGAFLLDVLIGAVILAVLFVVLANKNTGDTSGLDSVSLRILGDRHWFYVTSGDTVWDVHDTTFWALLGFAVAWVVLVLIVLRSSFTPGRAILGVGRGGRGRRGPAPSGPAPAGPTGAPGAPQWDPARGTYIQWDPGRRVWLQWNPAAQQWTPIG